ncbi:hypothetical protein SLS63_014221 [Diaporthe eres]|uniref:PiggyBac transposable element-derived protein domain-containing protein n=1 Tax=Diaporthe eres TaxID=83184 RepID=A0ABR1NKD7_DIAER
MASPSKASKGGRKPKQPKSTPRPIQDSDMDVDHATISSSHSEDGMNSPVHQPEGDSGDAIEAVSDAQQQINPAHSDEEAVQTPNIQSDDNQPLNDNDQKRQLEIDDTNDDEEAEQPTKEPKQAQANVEQSGKRRVRKYDVDEAVVKAARRQIESESDDQDPLSLQYRQQNYKDVTMWTYKGEHLPPAPEAIDWMSNGMDVTSYYLDKVLQSEFGDVRRIVADGIPTMSVRRPCQMMLNVKSQQIFKPIRQQQFSAIAGHLFMSTDKAFQGVKCKTCRASTCTGPFARCVFNPNGYFKGACTNCQAKSVAKGCNYKSAQIAKPKPAKLEMSDDQGNEDEDSDLVELASDARTPKRRKLDQKKSKPGQARSSKNASHHQVYSPEPPQPTRTPVYSTQSQPYSTQSQPYSIQPQPYSTQPQTYSAVQHQPGLIAPTWINLASDECLTTLSNEITQEIGRRTMLKFGQPGQPGQPFYMDGQTDDTVFKD